jgi:hypothetical protein
MATRLTNRTRDRDVVTTVRARLGTVCLCILASGACSGQKPYAALNEVPRTPAPPRSSWAPLKTHPTVRPSLPSAAGVPRCHARQLRARYVTIEGIRVTNVGGTSCFVRGTPGFYAYDGSGTLDSREYPIRKRYPRDHGAKIALFPKGSSGFDAVFAQFDTSGIGAHGRPCSHEHPFRELRLRASAIGPLHVSIQPGGRYFKAAGSCGGVIAPLPFVRPS